MAALQGPYGILPTPFAADGAVDMDQIRTMAARLCRTALSGVVVCGSTSEAVMLTPRQNMDIMTAVAEVIRREAPGKQLVCGVTAADIHTSRGYLEHARSLEAAAVLAAPPYYFNYSPREVLQFFRELDAFALGMAIVAYQIPAFTSPIPAALLCELAALPHVAGLKNSSANIKEILHELQLREQVGRPFAILSGTDDALLPCLISGCDGSFTALAAILPEHICALHAAVAAGDLRRARELQYSLLPLLRLADGFPFPVGYKLLAEAAGCMTTAYRQSLPQDIRDAMKNAAIQMDKELKALKL